MYSKITQLRQSGKRRAADALASDQGVFGCVGVYNANTHIYMMCYAWEDRSLMRPLLPNLIDPIVRKWHDNKLLYRGYQCAGEGHPVFLQEWVIDMIGIEPPTK